MDSILNSVKKLLGPGASDDSFDPDIIMHINTTLADLIDLGIGPSDGFVIEDEYSVWTDFVPYEVFCKLPQLVTYVYLRVKLVFDPPTNSSVLASMQSEINKFEWKLNRKVESEEML